MTAEDVKAKYLRKFREQCKYVLWLWEDLPEPTGEPPLQFSDSLARAFFMSSMVHLAYQAFQLGRKYERKKAKRKATQRFLGKNH